MKRGRKPKIGIYHAESSVRSFSIKIYVEQIKGYSEGCDESELITVFLQNIENVDRKRMHIIAILHNQDFVENSDFWEPSAEKPHIHIWGIIIGSPPKLRTVFNVLGIDGSRKEDAEMWKHHGAEPLASSLDECALYATHETTQAIKDGKTKYSIDDIHTNLSREELEELRGKSAENQEGKELSRNIEIEKLSEEVYELGYNLGDFEDWLYELPFLIHTNPKYERIFKRYYDRGIRKRKETDSHINKLSIFIQSEAGEGKTYTTCEVLQQMSLKTYVVDGGGTGKFDDLKPSHDAIVIDDYYSENLLNMADNKICNVYRRKSDNPVFAGQIFIALNNEDFVQWIQKCNPKLLQKDMFGSFFIPRSILRAIEDRFYICKLENGKLILIKPSERGTPKEQQERLDLFLQFQEKFEKSLANFDRNPIAVDYSDAFKNQLSKYDELISELAPALNCQTYEEFKPYEQKLVELHQEISYICNHVRTKQDLVDTEFYNELVELQKSLKAS